MSLRSWLGNERGSFSVELAILAPILLMLILLAVAFGRVGYAENQLQSVANAAAREASLSRTSQAAQQNAMDAAQQAATQIGLRCQSLNIDLDTSGLNSALGQTGVVHASLNCTVNLSDVALPGLPGSRTISAAAASVVDPYRERQ